MGVKHIFTTQRTLCFAICALRQHRSWRQHKDLSCVITKPGKSIQCDREKLYNLRFMFCLWARVNVETSLGGGDCGLWGESVLKPSTVIVLSNHHQPARAQGSLVSQRL